MLTAILQERRRPLTPSLSPLGRGRRLVYDAMHLGDELPLFSPFLGGRGLRRTSAERTGKFGKYRHESWPLALIYKSAAGDVATIILINRIFILYAIIFLA